MNEGEKKEYEELKGLLYTGTISQYGKRKLIEIIEKQSKEIEILNKNMNLLREQNISYKQSIHGLKEMNKIINKKLEDKIKAKIEPVLKQLERKMEEEYNKYGNSREYQDVVDAYNFLQSLLEKE